MDERNVAREMVEEFGSKVMMDEPECVLWRSKHENCKGCPYELGCVKIVGIKALEVESQLYNPHSFEDHLKTRRALNDIMQRILAAKTVEEVHQATEKFI